MLVFTAFLTTFIWWELRTPAPMLDLRLFRRRVFALGVLASFLSFLGTSSVRFLMPFYLQGVMGLRPSQVGIVMLPTAVTMTIIGPVAGRLSDRYGWRPFTVAGLTLAAIGLYLIWRGFHLPPKPRDPKWVTPLGLAGGFMDASGGGGWGPIVTSNLLLQGASPRHTIGTVNSVEFALTLSISLTFLIHLGWETFTTYTIGLLIGGVVAAPFGAMLARRIAPRFLFSAVGVILTLTSAFGIGKWLGFIG